MNLSMTRLLAGLGAAALLLCVVRVLPLVPQRENIVYENGDTEVVNGDVKTFFIGDIPLKRGIYELSVLYRAGHHMEVSLTAPAAGGGDCLRTSRMILSPYRSTAAYRFYAEADEAAGRLAFTEQMAGSNFSVTQITFRYRRGVTVLYYLMRTLFPFALLAAGALYVRFYRNLTDAKQKAVAAGLAALVIIVNIPLFLPYVPWGGDLSLHASRIARLGETLRLGAFPVRIQTGWYMDYGYPVSVFYGDAFLYPFALLNVTGVPLWRCCQLYVCCVNLVAVAGSFLCCRYITRDDASGLFGCALYVTSTYYLIDVYHRAALAEATAMAFVPFVIMGFAALLENETRTCIICLVTGFTGIVESHLITTVMTALFSVLFVLITLRRILRDGRVLTLAKAGLLALALNAGFIVPFLDYYIRCDIMAEEGGRIRSYGTTVAQWFMTEYNVLGMAGRIEDGVAGDMPQTAGLALLGVLFLALCVLFAGGFRQEQRKALYPLGFGLAALVMTTDVFPYDAIADKLPLLYAVLGKNVYYPFRYNTVAVACLSLLGACLFCFYRRSKYRQAAYTAAIVLACVSVLTGIQLMSRQINASAPFRALDSPGTGYEGDDMYAPAGANLDETRGMEIRIPEPEGIAVTKLDRRGLSFQMTVENRTDEVRFIDLPLWYFPGYTASGEDASGPETALPLSAGDESRVRLEVPAGFSGNIRTAFREPAYWRLAEAISALSVVCSLYLLLKGRFAIRKVNA